ncbi:MAG: acyltransferase family protein [Candidatus Cryptobacteroides sp.]
MRRLWVDNLRWVTVLLVVFYHCFYIFNSVGVFGGIGAFSENQPQDAVEYVLYPWFMALLFLLAGMSSRWALENKSAKEWWRSRTLKLLVPSTIGLFVLQWIVGFFNAQPGMAELSSVPVFVRYFIYVLSGIGPLWFIQLLWLYSLLLLLVHKLDSKDRFYNLCGTAFSNSVGAVMLLFVFFFLSWGGSLLTSYDAPLMGLYRIPFYIVPFLFGYFVFSQDKVLDRFKGLGPHAAVLFVLMAVLYTWHWFPENYTSATVQQHWSTMLFASIGSVCLLIVFRQYFDKSCPVCKYLSKRSFGIYILHYLPLVVLATFLKKSAIAPVWIYLILIVSVPLLSIALYELLSRIPFIRWAVFGIKKAKKQ